jgi:hypothetical protein
VGGSSCIEECECSGARTCENGLSYIAQDGMWNDVISDFIHGIVSEN